MKPLLIATRGSALAMAQAGQCADFISATTGRAVELVPVTTFGDTSRESLQTIGGTGVFASAVREAILDGRCDAAVHSAKDLPTVPCEGLHIASTPVREDPRDALITRDQQLLADLPLGATVGTGSPRRAVQLKVMRPDLEVVDIRGNVERRLEFVTSGELDAVVLAMAGLNRLGFADKVSEIFSVDRMIPAAGQGILALECKTGDDVTTELLRAIHHAETAACLTAERSVLRTLELGCSAPVAAFAQHTADHVLSLNACQANDDLCSVTQHTMSGVPDKAEQLGRETAHAITSGSVSACVQSTHPTTAGDS